MDLVGTDVMSSIMSFIDREYIFLATINRTARDCFWGSNTTRLSTCFESFERLQFSQIEDERGDFDKYINTCGNLEILKYSITVGWNTRPNDALEHAVLTCNHAMIDWLRWVQLEGVGPPCMIAAVKSGDLDLVRTFCVDGILDPQADNFVPLGNVFTYTLAIRERTSICLKWKQGFGDDLVDAALELGHLYILKWLRKQGVSVRAGEPIGSAARHGKRNILR